VQCGSIGTTDWIDVSKRARMPRMKIALLLAALAALAAGCSSPRPEPAAPVTAAPPRLPPSMGGVVGSEPAAPASSDMPSSAAPPVSDEIAKGMRALEANDTAAAKSSAEAALKKNPKDGEALALLGMVLERTGDKGGAEKAYKDALKARPDLEAAAVNLSAMYADSEKWDDAEKVSRIGLQRHADNPLLHVNLAIALAGKSDRGQSGKEFEEASRLAPKQAMPLYVYGHWLGVWNQSDQAAAKLRAARALADGDAAMLGAIGHELLLLRAVQDCVPTFDKAIAVKDAAEFRTERGLCKLAANDRTGALGDFQAAVAGEPTYALAHYWLGGLYAQSGKGKDAQRELEAYLKLAPNGPKARAAKDALTKLKASNKK
jgi:Tfp pilus assembly protein PilF